MDNTKRYDGVIDLSAGQQPPEVNARVSGMTTRVKKITTTDEAKLQVVLETEGMDDEALEQIKEMLVLQQSCLVKISMVPVQRDMFDA